MRRLSGICICLGMLILGTAGPAGAADSATPRIVSVDIGAQPLGDALAEFGKQADLTMVFYDDDLVRGLNSQPLSGKFTAEDALAKLLSNTGLKYEYLDARTIAIRAQKPKSTASSLPADARPVEELRMAQATEPAAPQEEGREESAARSRGLPEILVKGKRSLNMDIKRSKDDIQPYIVYDRAFIQNSTARNVEDLLRDRLNASTAVQTAAQTDGGGVESYIDLRGLGSAQTLILVDGHRVASTHGGIQPDVNAIPLAAIERIEILPATASGIYGGGATGGVVNIVMRRDYSGIETRLSYENSFAGGGSARRAEMSGGMNFEGGKTNVMMVASYIDGSTLKTGDRNYYARGIQRLLANDPASVIPGFSPPVGLTTNICAASEYVPGSPQFGGFCNGTPLMLDNGTVLSSTVTSVPAGYVGPASDNGAQLAANAGNYNFSSPPTIQYFGGGARAMLAEPSVQSFKAAVRRKFTSRVELFVDASTSKNKGRFPSTYASGNFVLAADDPANPFDQTVAVTAPLYGLNELGTQSDTDNRAVAGAIVELPFEWQLAVDYTWNQTKYLPTYASDGLVDAAGTAVRTGVTAGGAPFNVFRDFTDNPLNFESYVKERTQGSEVEVVLRNAAVRLAGPLGFSLPGGDVRLSMLLEHRKEVLEDFVLSAPTYTIINGGNSQRVDSVYAETLLPVISERNAIPGVMRLEFQAAGRRDKYEMVATNQRVIIPGLPDPEFGISTRRFTATDPTFGVRYQPLEDLTLRASYGTGFLPPTPSLLVASAEQSGDGLSFGLTDPLRNDEPLGPFTYATGGNPDLRPEESESRSIGAILTPRFAPGLRMSVDWIRIEKHDNVTVLGMDQNLLNNEQYFGGVIERAAPGPGETVGRIVHINSTILNVARQTVAAYDFDIGYTWRMASAGEFKFSVNATRNMENRSQVLANQPAYEVVGLTGIPKWRGSAALNWTSGSWDAQWTTRYYGEYCLLTNCAASSSTVAQGLRGVGQQIYHDLTAGYRFSGASALLSDLEARLGVRNLFDKDPPVDMSSIPYYSTVADPRGAMYYLSLRKGFL